MKAINALLFKIVIVTTALSILSACGWRLRGSEQTLESLAAIYLAPASGDVYQRIRTSLTKNKRAATLTDANLQLILGKQSWKRRTASVSNQALAAEYELTLKVPYEILDSASRSLSGSATAELSRSYTFDQNDIAGADKEEQLLRKEMVRQMARQILQRTTFLNQQK